MIPKSLILSFLALQGPGMSPSSRTNDVVVLSDVSAASQEVMTLGGGNNGLTGWSAHTLGEKVADVSNSTQCSLLSSAFYTTLRSSPAAYAIRSSLLLRARFGYHCLFHFALCLFSNIPVAKGVPC
jgi:hypothetical protein